MSVVWFLFRLSETLSEEKPCIDCFLGDLRSFWKVSLRRKPLGSCLYLHYIIIVIIIANIIIIAIIVITNIIIISSIVTACNVCQIYFNLILDLDWYIYMLDAYYQPKIMNNK